MSYNQQAASSVKTLFPGQCVWSAASQLHDLERVSCPVTLPALISSTGELHVAVTDGEMCAKEPRHCACPREALGKEWLCNLR